jgi:hypothetical protein
MRSFSDVMFTDDFSAVRLVLLVILVDGDDDVKDFCSVASFVAAFAAADGGRRPGWSLNKEHHRRGAPFMVRLSSTRPRDER